MSRIHDELCQIEQSMGVCHIAEFQPWPGMNKAGAPPKSSGSDVRSPSNQIQRIVDVDAVMAVMDVVNASHGPSSRAPAQVPQPAPSVVPLGPPSRHPPPTTREVSVPDASTAAQGGTGRGPRLGGGKGQGPSATPSKRGGNPPDVADGRFDQLDATIAWFVDQGLRESTVRGASKTPTGALLCGRIPQQIADLRSHTRKLAAHCDSLQVTTSHGNAASFDGSSGTTLEHLEAAHMSVMYLAKRLLEEGGSARGAITSPTRMAQIERVPSLSGPGFVDSPELAVQPDGSHYQPERSRLEL